MTRKKIILIVVAVAAIAAGGATTCWTLFRDPPPPNPETARPEEIVEFFASEQFANLPPEKKQEYFEEVRQKNDGSPRRMMRSAENLTEQQREKLHENMGSIFMARMEQEINRYFDLPPEQRTAYLDEMIDRHEQRRQEWRNRRPPREDRAENNQADNQRRRDRGGRRGHWSPERRKRMLERIPGEQRARHMEFREAMRKRRQERGLPEHPWGRRR
ncbi:MAG: hypothetical protein JXA11_06530 [Phycisphaerae bacterium]|nr:hypothetical protein [Phycisphaerae bacterium]